MAFSEEADQLEKTRSITRDALGKHMYSSAVFFADKLVAMSDRNPADVYLLAQACLLSKQYRRALHLLRHENLLVENLRFKYLAAKCLEELKEWDECLQLLGDEDQTITTETFGEGNGAEEIAEETQEISIVAVLCLLRGRAYAALENCGKAVHWYKEALRADPFCYEAFEQLVSNQMLSNEEEMQLLQELRFSPEDRWLRLLYECKANKYGQEDTLGAKLAELEGHGPALEDQMPCWQEGVHPLEGNADVQECVAEFQFHLGDYERSYATSKMVLDTDPCCLTVMPCHLASALELGRKNELFIQGHTLVEQHPKMALSWYAVGCYYFCIKQYDQARRFFSKATSIDASFAPAWIGFGNSYAAQDESEQAMSAYRAAARRFPGCHLAALSIGMEYQKANNFPLAKKFLTEACRMCSRDPLVHHELGVLAYRNNDFTTAAKCYKEALTLVPPKAKGRWEATMLNLGHALRRLGKFDSAIQSYEEAISVNPQLASGFAALGLTLQMQGDTRMAIEFYHKALGIDPNDSLTTDLLKEALVEHNLLYASEAANAEF